MPSTLNPQPEALRSTLDQQLQSFRSEGHKSRKFYAELPLMGFGRCRGGRCSSAVVHGRGAIGSGRFRVGGGLHYAVPAHYPK